MDDNTGRIHQGNLKLLKAILKDSELFHAIRALGLVVDSICSRCRATFASTDEYCGNCVGGHPHKTTYRRVRIKQ